MSGASHVSCLSVQSSRLELRDSVPGVSGDSHYFSARPAASSRRRTVQLRLSDFSADLVTDRGVFSYRRIDYGTRLLLELGPRPPEGSPAVGLPTLLDLGCGYGPIALSLAHRSASATVWAVDVNLRALELARLNTREFRGRVKVAAPAEVPESLLFDAIYCNPPVRIGKTELGVLLNRWLGRLAKGGFAALVTHKNLGGESLGHSLTERGWVVTPTAKKAGYRVFKVTASPAAE